VYKTVDLFFGKSYYNSVRFFRVGFSAEKYRGNVRKGNSFWRTDEDTKVKNSKRGERGKAARRADKNKRMVYL
jgi:hypothetical protein